MAECYIAGAGGGNKQIIGAVTSGSTQGNVVQVKLGGIPKVLYISKGKIAVNSGLATFAIFVLPTVGASCGIQVVYAGDITITVTADGFSVLAAATYGITQELAYVAIM